MANVVCGINIDELLDVRITELNPAYVVVRKSDRKPIRINSKVTFKSVAAAKGAIAWLAKDHVNYHSGTWQQDRLDIKNAILELVDFEQI